MPRTLGARARPDLVFAARLLPLMLRRLEFFLRACDLQPRKLHSHFSGAASICALLSWSRSRFEQFPPWLQSALCSITQASDPVMCRLDFGELKRNKLLS